MGDFFKQLLIRARGWWLKIQLSFWRMGYLTHRINVDRLARLFNVDRPVAPENNSASTQIGAPKHVANEAEIAHFCDELLRRGLTRLERQHSKVVKRAGLLDLPRVTSELESFTQRAESRAKSIRAASEMRVAQALEAGVECEDEYQRFRTDNELDRGARLPRFRGLYFVFVALLAGILTVTLSGWLYSSYSVSSLVGAIPLACALTLAPAIAGAFGLRYINHVNGLLMLLGMAVAVVVTGSIVALALVVEPMWGSEWSAAMWREHIATWVAEPLALVRAVDPVKAAILIGSGLAAFIAGYVMDDHYPFYGRVRRRMAIARKEYARLTGAVQDKVSAVFKGELGKLTHQRDKAHNQYMKFVKTQAKFDKGCRTYDAYRESVGNVANLLLARRNQNLADSPPLPSRYEALYPSSASLSTTSEIETLHSLQLQADRMQQACDIAKHRLLALEMSYDTLDDDVIVASEVAAVPLRNERKKKLTGFQPSRKRQAAN